MEPMYFGAPEQPLFGVYHPPTTDRARPYGIVACAPLGQEAIRSHRAYFLLADRLAAAGFHVLRFDLSGCGDSWGDLEQAALPRWQADVSRAIEEMREACHIARVALVGLRFGASLAALVGSERDDVDAVVLWDPVIDGHAHVAELVTMQERWRQGSFARVEEVPGGREILGFGFTDDLLAAVAAVDLRRLRKRPARAALVIESRVTAAAPRLAEELVALGVEAEYQNVPAPAFWAKLDDDIDGPLVPQRLLQAIASWLPKVAA